MGFGFSTKNKIDVERRFKTIDWDQLRADYRKRIEWEVEQGLNPKEASVIHQKSTDAEVVRDSSERPSGKSKYHRTPHGNNPDGAPRRYNHDKIIKLYVEEHLSGKRIAELIGANPATIYGILKRNGVTRDYTGNGRRFTQQESV